MTHKVYIHKQGEDCVGFHVFTYQGIRNSWTVLGPHGSVLSIYPEGDGLLAAVKQYMLDTCGYDCQLDSFIERPDGDLEVIIIEQQQNCFTWNQNNLSESGNQESVCSYTGTTESRYARKRRYLTMMPDSNYEVVAASLSIRDLKFMRVASLRVLRGLNGGVGSTKRCVRMWSGYKQSLIRYGMAMAKELRNLRENDNSLRTFQEAAEPGLHSKPAWVYWPRLQKSHQSYLVLRGLRDAFVERMHTHLVHASTKGPMEHLRSTGLPHRPRNLSRSDIASFLRTNSLINPYADLYDAEPEENFVYPEA